MSIIDPIIDRSPAQKLAHLARLREELREMGYSVVTTAWLSVTLDKIVLMEERTMEAAE
jgi:hypothetical protein